MNDSTFFSLLASHYGCAVWVFIRRTICQSRIGTAYLLLLVVTLFGGGALPAAAQIVATNIGSNAYTPVNTPVHYEWQGDPNLGYVRWDMVFGGAYGTIDPNTVTATSADVTWTSTGQAYLSYFTARNSDGDSYPQGWEEATLSLTVVSCTPAPGALVTNAIFLGTFDGPCRRTVTTTPVDISQCYLDDYTNRYRDNQPSPDIFYFFDVPDGNHKIKISTCGSNFNTVLHILGTNPDRKISNGTTINPNAPCANLAYWEYGDVSTGGLPQGRYFIVAEGVGNSTGTLALSITSEPLVLPTYGISLTANGQPLSSAIIEIAPGGSVTLGATGLDNYTWTPSTGVLGSTTGPTIAVSPQYTTTYTVSGTVATPCNGTLSLSQYVTVQVVYSNRNYITTRSTQEAGITTVNDLLNGLPPEKLQVATTYFDGLGRQEQQVNRQAGPGPDKLDLVTPIEYDLMGRPTAAYLPYTQGTDGIFKLNALAQQAAFYQVTRDRVANDNAPWSVIEHETSPLDRVIRQGAPGSTWQPDATAAWSSNDHTRKFLHRTNNTSNEVRQWDVGATTATVSSSGFYSAGQLSVTESKDENGHLAIEYQDKEGHTVMKKVQEAASNPQQDSDFLITHYVYDDLGSLRVVIQPKGARTLALSGATGNLTTSFLTDYCFRYEYDAQHRITEKYVPGGGSTYYAYDRRNQVVGTQDQQQASTGTWTIAKYDALNRPLLTAFVSLSMDRATLQTQLDGLPANTLSYEGRTTTGNIGYTLTQAYPSVQEGDVRTVTFYDDYNYPQLTNLPSNGFVSELNVPTAATTGPIDPESPTAILNGQVTGRAERVLTTGTPWLATKLFYNGRLQPVQQLTQHFPNGNSRTTTHPDFVGRPVATLATQTWNSATHSARNDYQYDHTGRVIQVKQTMDAGLATAQPEVIMAKNEYNAVGQLVDKKLHSVNNGSTYLQSVDYRYNIRGWLSNINNRDFSHNPNNFYNDADPDDDISTEVDEDLFGMELMYHANQSLNLSPAQYNGNISEVIWRTGNPNTGKKLNGYAYHYDPANRIISADFRTRDDLSGVWSIQNNVDYSVPQVGYDANGNITRMERKGQISTPNTSAVYGDLDKLSYSYVGNRLVGVDEDATSSMPSGIITAATHDFEDNGSRYTVGNDEYGYDASGRLTRDANKQISSVQYNYLGLLQSISFLGRIGNVPTITFIYSANGQKLRKTVSRGKTLISQTDYVNGFVYETKPTGGFGTATLLSFAPSPEGRVLFTPTTSSTSPYNWKYEYHLKDHLGNLRFAFRADKDNGVETQIVAGMEPVNAAEEEQQFKHVAETRFADPSHARTGDYVAHLNARSGHRDGPSIRLKVAAGDSIRAEVYGRYDQETSVGSLLQRGALVAGATIAGTQDQREAEQTQPATARRRWLPYFGVSIGIVPQLLKAKRTELPNAYLRYEVFNKDSQLVETKLQALQRTTTDEWQHLKTGTKVDSAGFVHVSLVNESGTAAYFDDMALARVAPSPIQENHYDPFGLNLVGIEEANVPNSNFQYNGKEKQEDLGLNWTDYGTRMYDAQLGRWHVADPLADKALDWTPYRYGFDNPVRYLDNDGKYETDGHFWTVYLMAVLMGRNDAFKIAYYTEAPDNIMNRAGDIVSSPSTWLDSQSQYDIHALNGGRSDEQREYGSQMIGFAHSYSALGIAFHFLGDSFAHSQIGNESQMYPHGRGHLFDGHDPDKIALRPNLYTSYVNKLSNEMAKKFSFKGDVDMFTFNYVAGSGGSTEANSAVFETEVRLREGVKSFGMDGSQADAVNGYLKSRSAHYGNGSGYKATNVKTEYYQRNGNGDWYMEHRERTIVNQL